MNKRPYEKPWLSYDDQVALLQSRGMLVNDPKSARDFLSHVNYYRFSGYCLAFEASRHKFYGGVTFEKVQYAYDFDRTLRDLITEGLETVEIDLRTSIAYHFGGKYDAFGHVISSNFFGRFNHGEWLDKLRNEATRSSELFIAHFRENYTEFPNLPVWVITETMSLGSLSRMYSGMLENDRKTISHRYGLQPETLESWMHHITYVRNLCAHHSRLWDRVWAIKPRSAYGKAWQQPLLPGNNRLFITILILNYIMRQCPAIIDFANDWRTRIEKLIDCQPKSPKTINLMGLTTTWKSHPVWKSKS